MPSCAASIRYRVPSWNCHLTPPSLPESPQARTRLLGRPTAGHCERRLKLPKFGRQVRSRMKTQPSPLPYQPPGPQPPVAASKLLNQNTLEKKQQFRYLSRRLAGRRRKQPAPQPRNDALPASRLPFRFCPTPLSTHRSEFCFVALSHSQMRHHPHINP